MMWLLELALVSLLGENIFGNCKSSSEVTGGLSAELVVRAQEPGKRPFSPALLPSTAFVSCQARGIGVLTGALPSNTSLSDPSSQQAVFMGASPLRLEDQEFPVSPDQTHLPLEALLSGCQPLHCVLVQILMHIFIYKYF